MARKKRGSMLMGLIKLLLILGVLSVLVLFGHLLWQKHSFTKAENSAHPVIVLGAQVQPDGEPSLQLQWRLEKALETYKHSPRLIVVCGAKGANEPAPEAQIMRDWLISRGVQADHILMDANSFNTKQNIQNAIALLPVGTKQVTLVTSDYHMPRALFIARDLGLAADGIASPIKGEYWIKNHFRETLAWGKYYLLKYLPFED